MRTHFTRSPHTVPLEDRDYPEWRRGRERYGIWMIDADTEPVRERIALVRGELGDLLSEHQRSAHVTVFVCGFLVDKAADYASIDGFHNDDFEHAMRERQRAALAGARLPAFSLEIGGVNSFDSALFLDVSGAAGPLRAARAALRRGQPEVCPGRYRPHLTVGLYRDAFAKHELRRRLAKLATLPPLRVAVSELVFASYQACSHSGPLEVIERVALAPPR